MGYDYNGPDPNQSTRRKANGRGLSPNLTRYQSFVLRCFNSVFSCFMAALYESWSLEASSASPTQSTTAESQVFVRTAHFGDV